MAAPQVDPRTRHFGAFYGLVEPAGDGPVVLVVGNCQAESLRIMLDGPDLRTVRLPPVHELTAADLPHLARWLARTELLITQPIHDHYHGLPLGSAQLSDQLGPGARTVRVPVIRFAGLYPAHAIVRPPSDPSLVPPVVAYHDLRVLAEAAALGRSARLDVAAVRAIAEQSLDQLRIREAAHRTVVVSDLFATPSFAQMRTLNHPGNPVWTELAARVRAALGLPEHVVDPGRPLLDSVHAPREAAVIEAWGLDEPERPWVVDGRVVETGAVREAHLAWYARHPDAVRAGLVRHESALRTLGLT
ncbi:hypothetical protein GCM10010172_40030 [Paractinoplanes ferrugineus]|uniref:Polysaccharide biosynthesis enzyme WcbI domain-containing protein n=1 Tax=Paractinoplanes ferrugineus TaxID=113564 RepID=A0A919MHP3_9ACTN|nr:WcbI family polysaccharide biosynthesis putative acetyltransferase [Actinoplanes ferrugineus]GIE16038.1 hypothetical protein Afe05nite_78780 [Actinoplanes ferrugineus]